MAADLAVELTRLVKRKFGGSPLSKKFLDRINEGKLTKEFHQIKWLTFSEARKLITDYNTLMALDQIAASMGVHFDS